MELKLKRDLLNESFTLGELFIDGIHFCYTVEDVVRHEGVKVAGKTAIPYGKYKVIINMSNRFQRLMPLLLNVKGFEGVRIHSGNTAADTEGCIIVGTVREPNGVSLSRICYTKLMTKLKD
jgi:hypothetical protein